jgi:bifunctional DNase/RNase
LKTEEGDKTLPIWIGLLEATSIASALQDIQFDRPMTHDLFKNLTQMLNVHINRIDICDLKDNTFYAEIHFASEERSFTMDARPSDAIALALRFQAPIFVDERVMEKSQAAHRPERCWTTAKREKSGPNTLKTSLLKISVSTKSKAFFSR